ncbi:hypothetical protein BDV26DRAFT_297784 [Aspergillus bertholletiae]|uniref:Uncharacterized protein n=1 Tax=Aspergillus bertholletiae TaxID=1226010 RepID=A0A5N7ARM1_9EURO|nr:hypothetical protein BDV26DRAFT_297784 [Aspergillus bertholletiae]
MSIPSTFNAAVLPKKGARHMVISDRSLGSLGPDEVVVRTKAIAINPLDWKIRDTGLFISSFLTSRTVDFVTSHTNIAHTWFDLAYIPIGEDSDELPMPLSNPDMEIATSDARQEHMSIEYWGTNLQESDIGRVSPSRPGVVYYNNTYTAMRVISNSYNLFYSVYCTNEHELFDLTVSVSQYKEKQFPYPMMADS